jgi:DNA polymerase
MKAIAIHSFEQWRRAARTLLQEGVAPETVLWSESAETPDLFGDPAPTVSAPHVQTMLVPAEFVSLAKIAACYRYMGRWGLLYKVLWRLTHGEPHLLKIETDDDVRRLRLMEKAVRRDIHKMHAFVRFRKVVDEQGERFIAWHEPAHEIVEEAIPFFVRRFGSMRWSILTPDRSALWDGTVLQFGPGVSRSDAPQGDELETLWRSYYASIFNPARVKVRSMKQHMAVRHWSTLPETALIPDLLREAPSRVQKMQEAQPANASAFVPAQFDLPALQKAASGCQGCPLYKPATQTVFGEGPVTASVVLVGEQPGDQEDVAGKPFVGPAGRLLDEALKAAGLVRSELYLTNAVKHFKYEQTSQRRIHKKPNGREIHACRPWLEAELALINPRAVVCLGATAAQSVLGRAVRISEERGKTIADGRFESLYVTAHPASILRLPDPELQRQAFAQLVADLRLVAQGTAAVRPLPVHQA